MLLIALLYVMLCTDCRLCNAVDALGHGRWLVGCTGIVTDLNHFIRLPLGSYSPAGGMHCHRLLSHERARAAKETSHHNIDPGFHPLNVCAPPICALSVHPFDLNFHNERLFLYLPVGYVTYVVRLGWEIFLSTVPVLVLYEGPYGQADD